METSLTKGVRVVNLQAFVASQFGACHWEELTALLPSAEAAALRTLAASEVLIWVRVAPHGELRLFRFAGEQGTGALRCFVLQMGEHAAAKLEVETPRSGSEALIAQLLPGLALALRDEGAQSDPTSDKTSPPPRSHRGEVQRQLGLAAACWTLTPRQTQVLAEVVVGLTNKEIAGELECEEGTVEVHVSKLLKKSGAGNRAGLIARLWSLK